MKSFKMNWQRIIPFESNKVQQEVWIYNNGKDQKKYNVEVTLGKTVDILSLKANILENFTKKVSSTRNSRLSIYKSRDNLERVDKCPVCGFSSDKAKDVDFLKDAKSFNCDIVTFWGLIEHVVSPIEMLKSARLALNKEGMVVADVPRWDSFSTAVHRAFPDSVIRHLDPHGPYPVFFRFFFDHRIYFKWL